MSTTQRARKKRPSTAREARDALMAYIPVPKEGRVGWKRIVLIGLSVVLILLGFAMVPVPVASGLVFWIPGALMLGVSVPTVGRTINKLEAKLPDRWRRRLRPTLWFRARNKLKQVSS